MQKEEALKEIAPTFLDFVLVSDLCAGDDRLATRPRIPKIQAIDVCHSTKNSTPDLAPGIQYQESLSVNAYLKSLAHPKQRIAV